MSAMIQSQPVPVFCRFWPISVEPAVALFHIISITHGQTANYLFIILLSGIINNLAMDYHLLAQMLFPDVVPASAQVRVLR
jgi:hypothetical protein